MNKILVLGDSHAECFLSTFWKNKYHSFKWETTIVYGATLSGLSNPNSNTMSNASFQSAMNENKADAIVTLLGEVDCGFVIWYYSDRDNIAVYTAAKKAIENYKQLLLKAKKKSPVFVISAPLPTIGDNDVHGVVAQKRSGISATQKQRTELTQYFNKEINMFCVNNDITFIDLDRFSKGKDGLVHASLINKNKSDHHYDKDKYMTLLGKFLMPYLIALFDADSNNNFNSGPFLKAGKHEIDLFRDAAVLLEVSDINMAYELMMLANKLRPTGPFIKEKLNEYEKLVNIETKSGVIN
ncbi:MULTISPECIES: hypothetical protein [unclassified Pseudoalteromonas]|uniref:hypothetical protein n=1 Tax=unclassified Pseudoalteromonas TaxID=194690 RepID=UPI0003F9C9A9|nr:MULTISPECIES: hypothetical protein [unclassified Pseudoalteromonas]